jgi:hypothetical protein
LRLLSAKSISLDIPFKAFIFTLHRKNIDRRREKFGYESVSTMGLSVAGADVFQVSATIQYCTYLYTSYTHMSIMGLSVVEADVLQTSAVHSTILRFTLVIPHMSTMWLLTAEADVLQI